MRSRLTSEGVASLDMDRLGRDFAAICRMRGVSPSAASRDIGLAAGTASHVISAQRTRRGSRERIGSLTGLSLVLICRWMRRDPVDYLVIEDETE